MPNRYGHLDALCPVEWGHPLNRGLVAEWAVTPLSGWRGGLTLRDLVRGGKNPHDGTLANGPTWGGPAGRPGGYGSLSFASASTQYAYARSAPPPAGFMGISLWFLTTAASSGLAGWNDNNAATSGTDDRELYVNASGGVEWYVYNGVVNTVRTSAAYNDGRWHHALGVIGTGGMALYLDGVLDSLAGVGSPASVAGGYNGYTTPFLVAGRVGHVGNTLNGRLDDVLVHGRAPSAAEVNTLYDQARRGNPDRWRWVPTRAYFLPAAGGGGTAYSDTGAGGVALGQSGTPAAALAPAATGGVALGGAGVATLAAVSAGSGAVVVGGAGAPSGAALPVASGGMVVGGAGAPSGAALPVASGGMVVGGAGSVSGSGSFYSETGSGGAVLAGAGQATLSVLPAASGGAALGQSGGVVLSALPAASGHATAGGAGTPAAAHSGVAVGGLAVGGSGASSAYLVPAATGFVLVIGAGLVIVSGAGALAAPAIVLASVVRGPLALASVVRGAVSL